jgi:hypothetical protein
VFSKIVNGLSILSLPFTLCSVIGLAYFNAKLCVLFAAIWLVGAFWMKPAESSADELGKMMTTQKFAAHLFLYWSFAAFPATMLTYLDDLPVAAAYQDLLGYALLGTVAINLFWWVQWFLEQFKSPGSPGPDEDDREPIPIDSFRPKPPQDSGSEEMKLAA